MKLESQGMPVFKYVVRVLILIPVIYLLAVGMAFMVPYFKVTDPEDPRFEPEKFQLIDTYWMHRDEEKFGSPYRKAHISMTKLFPHGTDISDVDNEFVTKRGCKKDDVSRVLKFKPYIDNPNSKVKKYIKYYCPYEWWGLFFYDLSEHDRPRLKTRIYLDENDKVIRPPPREKEK
ncbi:MAG: hypothetical protein KUF77_09835 [Candidatus Thiodiazotropha sp. (ex Lucina aurantia)]|nr:hypothetical protein [Candidatus Thiodiazotropha taylori]MBV2103310.1 hypothetical protein [Candidatus Thiodiazotropha sp. (ex Lucina aurantia)]